jgi:hypothetical protein
MADHRKPVLARPRCRNDHGHRTVWELAGFVAGLLLALPSAPFLWV